MKTICDYVVGFRQATNAEALITSAQIEAFQRGNVGISPDKIQTIPNGERPCHD